jgi:hypothetical protein
MWVLAGITIFLFYLLWIIIDLIGYLKLKDMHPKNVDGMKRPLLHRLFYNK